MAKSYGKKYAGSYTVEGGKVPLISVSALQPRLAGQKTTQVGGSPVEGLALILLHELVSEAKEKGWLKDG